jgi:glycosyltransferase involved in cell wall biosynthesis
MIDVQRHTVFDPESRARMREKKGIAADAIVIAIICRLEAEKGLEVAVESISRALSVCPSEVRSRVRVIIAGDGLLRKQLEEDIQRLELRQTCTLWGDIPSEEVISLLGISDIFLYTSTRGACIPMAVLEAMASGCAVIATTQPMANTQLLDEGRGIIVPPADAEQTAQALVRLMNDLELCQRMGKRARDYVAVYHSPDTFRRALMRVTSWSSLEELLNGERDRDDQEKE